MHIEEAVTAAWSSGAGCEFGKNRLVQTTVRFSRPLSSLMNWETALTTVYSIPPNTDTETLGIGEFQLIEGGYGEPRDIVKQRLRSSAIPDPLRWYGAFSFGEDESPGVWSSWPRSIWFVPTLTVVKSATSDEVEICYIGKADDSASDCQNKLNDLLPVRHGDNPYCRNVSNHCTEAHGDFDDMAMWTTKVERALEAIARGDVSKVVLARQVVESVEVTMAEALERLRDHYSTSYIFALFRDDRWFLAASPEQLVQTKAGRVYVDCLAGTTLRGKTVEEDEAFAVALLESKKNRNEHLAVVDFVKERLLRIVDELDIAPRPTIKRLQNLQHLYTPVEGQLKADCHLVDAASLLHPTPAVAGVPRKAAVPFLRQVEGWNRGYYAGAFGCMDGEGNGQLHVSLRSACVAYPHAVLFAGCGIVEGSVPEDEWNETDLKLEPIRSAIRRKK